jgi:cell division protease FtsH
VHTPGKRLADDVDFDVIARATPRCAGADLVNLVNEAAIVAVRPRPGHLTAADFDAARDRILLGRRHASNALLPDKKHAVAVRESGHSLVAALCADALSTPAGQEWHDRVVSVAVAKGLLLLTRYHSCLRAEEQG